MDEEREAERKTAQKMEKVKEDEKGNGEWMGRGWRETDEEKKRNKNKENMKWCSRELAAVIF